MSTHYYLYCDQTKECVEAIAHVGNWCGPRIEANALQAFLSYHHIVAAGSPLVMVQMEVITEDRNVVASLEEAAEEMESIGGIHGHRPPAMLWTEKNFHALAARVERLAAALQDYEHAPGGGRWVRLTSEGRLIEATGATISV